MQPSTIVIIKNLVLMLLLLTLFNSIVVMIGGKKIFNKSKRNPKVSLYPILNLFNILEIAEMQIFWGILFFVPFVNCIIMAVMFYKLGEVFNQKVSFKIGLSLLPICFYPLLSLSDVRYKAKDVDQLEEFTNLKDIDINLMSDEELNKLNSSAISDNKQVDSIFKSDEEILDSIEPIETYHANKVNNSNNLEKKDEDLEIVDL